MRKPVQFYDNELPADADYKTEYIYERDKANFESLNKWIYLGADVRNPRYAKIGITMGNLGSRSYSSANPGFHLLCAFQCDNRTTRIQLEKIERSALRYLDEMFTNEDGSTKRVCHYESGRLSECYYDIDFEYFFHCLHDFLYKNHTRHFSVYGFEDEGDYLACEFNPRLSRREINKYIRLILQ